MKPTVDVQPFSVGITASRTSPSELRPEQFRMVKRLLRLLFKRNATKRSPAEFHHGKCVGGDEEFGNMAYWIGYYVIVHPPVEKEWLSRKSKHHEKREPKTYLLRNMDILKESTLIIAAPKETVEQQRGSGTWHVIRHARKQKKPLIVVWKSGGTTMLNGAAKFLKD